MNSPVCCPLQRLPYSSIMAQFRPVIESNIKERPPLLMTARELNSSPIKSIMNTPLRFEVIFGKLNISLCTIIEFCA